MKQLRWLAVNGAFAACLWFGFVEGVAGARNIGLFIVWAAVPMALFALVPDVMKELRKSGGSAMPSVVDGGFDLCVLAFLLWFGAWASAIAFALHAFLMVGVRHEMRKPA